MAVLKGLKTLVTGAGGGIGAACARALAEAGADVAVADINGVAANTVAAECAKFGGSASAIEADCGDLKAIDSMINKAVTDMGRLDVIVNNAGVTRHAHIMDLDENDWDRMFRVNAKGVFFCMQRAAKSMISQGGGRIINIASVAGRGYYGTSNCAYAGTKGAVLAMTYVAAHQLGPNNINVNAICPGVTYTAIVEGLLSARSAEKGVTVEELKEEVGKSIPIRRGNDPEDIAAMAVFLAGPGARNITGQGFNVDGGLINS